MRTHPSIALPLLCFAVVLSACAGNSRAPEVDPEVRFLRVNAAVIEYLSELDPSELGDDPLEGVVVTIPVAEEGAGHLAAPDDETAEPLRETHLADVRYRGAAAGLPERVRVHWIDTDEGERALLWVERDGEPFALPECDAGGAGFRARRITGEIYTWRSARPLDGVLVTACPADEWKPAPPK